MTKADDQKALTSLVSWGADFLRGRLRMDLVVSWHRSVKPRRAPVPNRAVNLGILIAFYPTAELALVRKAAFGLDGPFLVFRP
jgi:hypothetical protein